MVMAYFQHSLKLISSTLTCNFISTQLFGAGTEPRWNSILLVLGAGRAGRSTFGCFYLNPAFVLNTHLSIMNVTWTSYTYGMEMAYPVVQPGNALQNVSASSDLLPLAASLWLHWLCLTGWSDGFKVTCLTRILPWLLEQERPVLSLWVNSVTTTKCLFMTNFDPNVV
jgi:hypothetical protein